MINILKELCDLCGTCVAVCEKDAIELTEFELIIDEEKCVLCMSCVDVCPFEALEES